MQRSFPVRCRAAMLVHGQQPSLRGLSCRGNVCGGAVLFRDGLLPAHMLKPHRLYGRGNGVHLDERCRGEWRLRPLLADKPTVFA